MSERAQNLMNCIWESRNSGGADTEEKLVSAVIQHVLSHVPQYGTQTDMVVINRDDLLSLCSELDNLK